MASQAKIESCRRNGAKGKGKKTTEGLARCALNATRHGLLARCVLIKGEPPESFQSMLDAMILRFRPTDVVELGFVEEMAAAKWRLHRLWATEQRTLDREMDKYTFEDALDALSEAFGSLAARTSQLTLIHRYETRLHRMYQRALHNLLLIRKTLPLTNSPLTYSDALEDESTEPAHEFSGVPNEATLGLGPAQPDAPSHTSQTTSPPSPDCG